MRLWLIGLVALNMSYGIWSQDCSQFGTRRILFCDNVVTVPKPPAIKDSVYNYWKYFQTAAGVKVVLDSIDTAKSCCIILSNANFVNSGDTVTSDLTYGLSRVSAPPSDTVKFADYVLYGTVTGNDAPLYILRLECAASRALVKADTQVLCYSFETIGVGKVAISGLGPIYQTIIDYEKKTRGSGGLYAIAPKVTFTADKTELSDGESVPLTVKVIDCDGTPLSNWPVTLTASAGSVNPVVVNTNAQGVATSVFTASNIKITALVTTILYYLQPSGQSAAASVLPINLSLNKPDGEWVATATYEYRYNTQTKSNGDYETGSSNLDTRIDIYFGARLFDISPVAGAFISDPDNYDIQWTANKSEESFNQRHWEQKDAGYIDEKGYYNIHASKKPNPAPLPVIRVSEDGYTFSLKKIEASQSGDGESRSETYLKTSPPESSNEKYKVDPDIVLSFSITGKSVDTTYTIIEQSDLGGISSTKTTQIHQTCSWEDTICMLGYDRDCTERIQVSTGINETTVNTEHTSLTAMLSHVGKKTSTRPYAKPGILLKNPILKSSKYNVADHTLFVHYCAPAQQNEVFTIVNMSGKEIARLVRNEVTAGDKFFSWNLAGIPMGVYLLRMKSGEWVGTQKITIVK
jgi:hypothetical protein